MKKRLMLPFFIILLCLSGCAESSLEQEATTASSSFFAMDTLFHIEINTDDEARAKDTLKQVEAEIKRLEKLTGCHEDPKEGNLAQINAMAGISPVTVDSELLQLLRLSLDWCEKTEGSFSIALGPLTTLWQNAEGTPPSDAEIQSLLPLCDYRDIVIDTQTASIFLPQKGMALDLGAVAKGYAIGKAKEIIETAGFTSALIDGGGSVYTIGVNTAKEPYRIGIAHPRQKDELAAVLSASDTAVVTSGDYQRYFEYQGIRYHHILDGKTGYPARGKIAVTVVNTNPTLADILSTAIFVADTSRTKKLADQADGVAIIKENLQVTLLGDFSERLIVPFNQDFIVSP